MGIGDPLPQEPRCFVSDSTFTTRCTTARRGDTSDDPSIFMRRLRWQDSRARHTWLAAGTNVVLHLRGK